VRGNEPGLGGDDEDVGGNLTTASVALVSG
jgi:hypothetical protein